MTDRILETEADVDGWVKLLKARKLPCTVTVKDGRDRTLSQNALLAKWYGEAAQQLGDRTFARVRAECKLELGVPILRRDEDRFRDIYNKTLLHLPYEDKVEFIEQTELPVTRCFKVKQMSEYMDLVERRFADQGIRLTHPDDRGRP